jgi:hypothetical protein
MLEMSTYRKPVKGKKIKKETEKKQKSKRRIKRK